MTNLLLAAAGVLALGLTTTLHPCPLATNIAAISVISGTSLQRRNYSLTVTGFALGYVTLFLMLAMIISNSVVAIPAASIFLQRIISAFLGPVLILTGMVVTKLINLNKHYPGLSLDKKYWLTSGSFFSSFVLGAILALTFCPATASVFFGVMIPISIKFNQPFLFPVLYAVGAMIPIVAVSLLLQQGMNIMVNKHWIRQIPQITGWVLIGLGVYITLVELYFK